MKNKILSTLAFISILVNVSKGQSEVSFFQVEETNFIKLDSFLSGTQFEAFNSIQGGKQIGKFCVNKEGNTLVDFAADQSPAFIINRKSRENLNGTNKVYFTEVKEFTAKNIELNLSNNTILLSWKAMMQDQSKLEFQVVRSINNSEFKLVKKFSAIQSSEFYNYEFSEPFVPNARYKLIILKEGKKLRYTSHELFVNVNNLLRVYPSVFQSNIHIDIATGGAYEYTVSDVSGRLVKEGHIFQMQNVVQLDDLNTGLYLLVLSNGIDKQSHRIIKE